MNNVGLSLACTAAIKQFHFVFVQIMNNVKHEKGKFAVMTHEACELNVQNTQTTRQKVRL